MGIKEWLLVSLSIIGGILWAIGEFAIHNFGMALAGVLIAVLPFIILIVLIFIKNSKNGINKQKKKD